MGKKSKRRRRSESSGVYSGQILGAVVDALDVGEGVLADKSAKRMFSGRSVSETSRKAILRALGQALVDLGIVPSIDEQLSRDPFRDDLKTADILTDVIGVMCVRWDTLMGHTQNRVASVTDFSGAGREFLRLAAVDIALRMMGFGQLADLDLPEPHVPVWAQPNGVGEILRAHLREAGLRQYQLAMGLEVSPTTVANWLSGQSKPRRYYLPALARELSLVHGVRAPDLEIRLRRQFALARLAETVAGVVGWEAVAADVEAVFRFAKLMQESNMLPGFFEQLAKVAEFEDLDVSDNPGWVGYLLLPMLLLLGSAAPFTPELLRWLAVRSEVHGWSDDIYAVASSPEMQFQVVAYRHSGENPYVGLAQDYFDVVNEPSADDLEARAAITRLETSEMDSLPLSRGVMDEPVRAFERYMAMPEPWRNLLHRFPGSAEAHYRLGALLCLMGSRLHDRALLDEGIMECWVASGLESRWDAPAVAPAVTLSNMDDWEGALRELDRAERTLPQVTPHFLLVRAMVLMNAERYEDALADYLVVGQTRPDFVAVWEGAAHCAFSIGNRTDGLEYAKKARVLGEPRVYDAWDRGAYGRRRKRRAS